MKSRLESASEDHWIPPLVMMQFYGLEIREARPAEDLGTIDSPAAANVSPFTSHTIAVPAGLSGRL